MKLNISDKMIYNYCFFSKLWLKKLNVYFSNTNKDIIVSGFASKIEIFDISAKKIFGIVENSENLSIPASDWAKGTYLIRVLQANTDLSVYKIIIPWQKWLVSIFIFHTARLNAATAIFFQAPTSVSNLSCWTQWKLK